MIHAAIERVMCNATSEGLVRYPNSLAPISGSDTVTAHCADNAHLTSSSLSVTCTPDGSWSGQIPLCECDDGHHVATVEDGREICRG